MVWSISSIGRMFAKYTLQKKIMDKLDIVYIFAQGMFSANQTAWLKMFRMHKLLIKMQMIYIYVYIYIYIYIYDISQVFKTDFTSQWDDPYLVYVRYGPCPNSLHVTNISFTWMQYHLWKPTFCKLGQIFKPISESSKSDSRPQKQFAWPPEFYHNIYHMEAEYIQYEMFRSKFLSAQ